MHRRLPASLPCRAVARVDVVAASAVAIVAVALIVPSLAAASGASAIDRSLANLRILGTAHATYALDWDGRQLTFVDDALSTYGSSITPAMSAYASAHGEPHPPVMLGWGLVDNVGPLGQFAYYTNFNPANGALLLPINFTSPVPYFGAFRIPNARQFHQYTGGRVYDEIFYAPADDVVLPVVEPAFDWPFEFFDFPPNANLGDIPVWSSYCLSPAAMFDPLVMGSPNAGGFVDPWSVPTGFTSPGYFQASYPDLKTHMLEHHWLQDRPADPCNPAWEPGTYGGCEPWYFNHGLASAPATLFYDGSARLLPNGAVQDADAMLMQLTGVGLWHRGTPFGADGYLNAAGIGDADLAHHILTVDGILGRDIVSGAAAGWRRDRDPALAPPPEALRRASATVRPPRARFSDHD